MPHRKNQCRLRSRKESGVPEMPYRRRVLSHSRQNEMRFFPDQCAAVLTWRCRPACKRKQTACHRRIAPSRRIENDSSNIVCYLSHLSYILNHFLRNSEEKEGRRPFLFLFRAIILLPLEAPDSGAGHRASREGGRTRLRPDYAYSCGNSADALPVLDKPPSGWDAPYRAARLHP